MGTSDVEGNWAGGAGLTKLAARRAGSTPKESKWESSKWESSSLKSFADSVKKRAWLFGPGKHRESTSSLNSTNSRACSGASSASLVFDHEAKTRVGSFLKPPSFSKTKVGSFLTTLSGRIVYEPRDSVAPDSRRTAEAVGGTPRPWAERGRNAEAAGGQARPGGGQVRAGAEAAGGSSQAGSASSRSPVRQSARNHRSGPSTRNLKPET